MTFEEILNQYGYEAPEDTIEQIVIAPQYVRRERQAIEIVIQQELGVLI